MSLTAVGKSPKPESQNNASRNAMRHFTCSVLCSYSSWHCQRWTASEQGTRRERWWRPARRLICSSQFPVAPFASPDPRPCCGPDTPPWTLWAGICKIPRCHPEGWTNSYWNECCRLGLVTIIMNSGRSKSVFPGFACHEWWMSRARNQRNYKGDKQSLFGMMGYSGSQYSQFKRRFVGPSFLPKIGLPYFDSQI